MFSDRPARAAAGVLDLAQQRGANRAPRGGQLGNLETRSTRTLRGGDAILLGADTVHAVANPSSEWTGAIHVYGGDYFTSGRRLWLDPGGPSCPGSQLAGWQLHVREGQDGAWEELASGSSDVLDAQLLGSHSFAAGTNGDHTLRLTVTTTDGRSYTDYAPLTVGRALISNYPADGTYEGAVALSGPVPLEGFAQGTGLTAYHLEYKADSASSFSVISATKTAPVEGGLLFDSSEYSFGCAASGPGTLRLVASFGSESAEHDIRIELTNSTLIAPDVQGSSGYITLEATLCRTDAGIKKLQFIVDGTSVSTKLVRSGTTVYSQRFNSRTLTDGQHTLTVIGLDRNGQAVAEESATFVVDN